MKKYVGGKNIFNPNKSVKPRAPMPIEFWVKWLDSVKNGDTLEQSGKLLAKIQEETE
jgi:hypothetical protein